MKLHRQIDLIEAKCSSQEPLLCITYFWSYCPLLFFILHSCPDHNSQTIRPINLKLCRWIDLIEQKRSTQELLLCTSYFWSYCPLLIFILHCCPDHNSQTIRPINLKLRRWIDLIEQKHSTQELLLCTSYFLSYCPLLFFILLFCLHRNSYTIRPINLKLYRWVYHTKEKCSAQEPLLCTSYFWSYCPLYFHT